MDTTATQSTSDENDRLVLSAQEQLSILTLHYERRLAHSRHRLAETEMQLAEVIVSAKAAEVLSQHGCSIDDYLIVNTPGGGFTIKPRFEAPEGNGDLLGSLGSGEGPVN